MTTFLSFSAKIKQKALLKYIVLHIVICAKALAVENQEIKVS